MDKQTTIVLYHCDSSDWTSTKLHSVSSRCQNENHLTFLVAGEKRGGKKRETERKKPTKLSAICNSTFAGWSSIQCHLQQTLITAHQEKCNSFIWLCAQIPNLRIFNSSLVCKVVTAHWASTVVACTKELHFWLTAQMMLLCHPCFPAERKNNLKIYLRSLQSRWYRSEDHRHVGEMLNFQCSLKKKENRKILMKTLSGRYYLAWQRLALQDH